MPEPEDKRPRPSADDTASEVVARAAEFVRTYQNHIVVAVCLVLLGVFGWNWWSKQRNLRESRGWSSLQEDNSLDDLRRAVEQYGNSSAAPLLRFELGKSLHDEGKLDEAQKIFEDLQSQDRYSLAGQLASQRLTAVKADRDFAKILPAKLKELAKNAPVNPPIQTNEHLGQQEEFGPPRDLIVPPPK